jgi:hypothetical protein
MNWSASERRFNSVGDKVGYVKVDVDEVLSDMSGIVGGCGFAKSGSDG